jgi:hypothetical protein
VTTITTPPADVPDINDPVTFAARAAAWVAWQDVAFPQVNLVRTEILTAQAEIVVTVDGFDANVAVITANIGSINTVAGIDANITTVAGISANVTTVAGDTTAINTVNTNVADVVNVSDNMAAILAAISGFNNTALTGVPTAPTAVLGTDTEQLATTAFVLENAPAGGATDIDGLSDGKTTGNGNVSLGSGAGGDFGSFGACTLVGIGAGRFLTGGSFNVAAGYFALGSTSGVTSANNNVALGPWALGSTQGDYNIGIGRSAGVGNFSTNTGGYNVSIGSLTGGALTTGGYNTIVGHGMGTGITTGEKNTIIGSWSGLAGTEITTGANNTLIGNRVVPSASTVSNEITLGDSSIATLRCQQTTITALSDERDKANITDISLGLEYLEKVRPVEFDWAMREGSDWNGKHVAGFIAQEMMAVEDEYDAAFLGSVLRSNPDKLEVGPAALLPIMVKAIQELSARVKELEAAR